MYPYILFKCRALVFILIDSCCFLKLSRYLHRICFFFFKPKIRFWWHLLELSRTVLPFLLGLQPQSIWRGGWRAAFQQLPSCEDPHCSQKTSFTWASEPASLSKNTAPAAYLPAPVYPVSSVWGSPLDHFH